MPARTSFSPRAIPRNFSRFCCFPKSKIQGILFLVARFNSCAYPKLINRLMGEFSVAFKSSRAVINITLRFIGWADDVAYDRLLASLDEADLGRAFSLELGEMGAFPRPKSSTVLWLGVSKGQTRLEEVASVVEEAVQAAGFDGEDRPFRAHLTLSRIRPPVDVTDLIGSITAAGLGWRCESIVVYRSHLGRGGARYEPLETFPLAR